MHIEKKNVCDNVVFTLLNDSSNKCKDNLEARKDLQLWGIRPDLWPDENGRYLPAIYPLTNEKKRYLSQNFEEHNCSRWLL